MRALRHTTCGFRFVARRRCTVQCSPSVTPRHTPFAVLASLQKLAVLRASASNPLLKTLGAKVIADISKSCVALRPGPLAPCWLRCKQPKPDRALAVQPCAPAHRNPPHRLISELLDLCSTSSRIPETACDTVLERYAARCARPFVFRAHRPEDASVASHPAGACDLFVPLRSCPSTTTQIAEPAPGTDRADIGPGPRGLASTPYCQCVGGPRRDLWRGRDCRASGLVEKLCIIVLLYTRAPLCVGNMDHPRHVQMWS